MSELDALTRHDRLKLRGRFGVPPPHHSGDGGQPRVSGRSAVVCFLKNPWRTVPSPFDRGDSRRPSGFPLREDPDAWPTAPSSISNPYRGTRHAVSDLPPLPFTSQFRGKANLGSPALFVNSLHSVDSREVVRKEE